MNCICGHPKSAHVYEEGPCRPGFRCGHKCEKYQPNQEENGEIKPDYWAELVEISRHEIVVNQFMRLREHGMVSQLDVAAGSAVCLAKVVEFQRTQIKSLLERVVNPIPFVAPAGWEPPKPPEPPKKSSVAQVLIRLALVWAKIETPLVLLAYAGIFLAIAVRCVSK